MLPIASGGTKAAAEPRDESAIFKLYSLGVKTNRDDWTVSPSKPNLIELYRYAADHYQKFVSALPAIKLGWKEMKFDTEIKWTRKLRKLAAGRKDVRVDESLVVPSIYRPYSTKFTTYASELNEDQYQLAKLYREGQPNPTIMLSGYPSAKPLQALGTKLLWHHDTVEKTNGLPRYRYTKSGERIDNITDWAVAQFEAHYGPSPLVGEDQGGGPAASAAEKTPAAESAESMSAQTRAAPSQPSPQGGGLRITKDAIFAYCYAVLLGPLYREKYALNLKREFPRIPFYDDFASWAAWGETLLKLHIDYESAKPFKLTRVDTPNPKRAKGAHPKPRLKSDPAAGLVVIDEDTQLTGIPPAAWTYRLGNRSAIDWVLDQHKEKTPRDPTIRLQFNTYRFADYKESMITLLAKVITVSLETVKITEAMRQLDRRRMTRWRLGGAPLDASIEIERFAAFDYPTRRFIAYAIQQVPQLAAFVGDPPSIAENMPAPFDVGGEEEAERAAAYSRLPALRLCRKKGAEGRRMRRMHFGDVLTMAKVDLKWKRLTTLPAFIFCYERLLGAEWRELLSPCWKEVVVQRRKKGPIQLPLDPRLKDDASVPSLLENDTPPIFYPSMSDADSIGAPLLSGL